MTKVPEIGVVEGAVDTIDAICERARKSILAELLDHAKAYPNSPWSYANVAKLEHTLTEAYRQWGKELKQSFSESMTGVCKEGYERAREDLKKSGVFQNLIGSPDVRRIENALKSVYTNVALRTDKMCADHIRQLRQFSAKVFREASLTGETRKAISDRLMAEALEVPGFKFIDISRRTWKDKTYFEMLARTELMNAGRESYDEQCAQNGCNIMKLSVSGNSCPYCARYEGCCFTIGPNDLGLPTKADLISNKVFHPNCTHSYAAVPDVIFQRDFTADGRPRKGYNSPGDNIERAKKETATDRDRKATAADLAARAPDLKSKSDAYFKSLSEEDRLAVQRYTNGDEYHLSKYIRAAEQAEDKTFRRTKTLDLEIERLNRILEDAPKWDGPVYRGMSFRTKEEFDSFLNNVNSGESMYFGFTSSSYDQAVAEKYIHADAPYKVMIHIENPQHGALIGNNSTKPSDREVLFPENIRFRLAKPRKGDTLKSGNGMIHIRMGEEKR